MTSKTRTLCTALALAFLPGLALAQVCRTDCAVEQRGPNGCCLSRLEQLRLPSAKKPVPNEKHTSALTELCTFNGKNLCRDRGPVAQPSMGPPLFVPSPGAAVTPTDAAHQRCERGDLQGCTDEAAYSLQKAKKAEDFSKIAALFSRACDGHIELACGALGVMLSTGLGVPRDPVRAAPLLVRGCAAEEREACSRLADAYWTGTGIARSPEKAAESYERACTAGDTLACNNVIKLLRGGHEVAADEARAWRLADRTCTAGNQPACELAAEALLQGRGVERDLPRGITLLRQSCDASVVEACTLLGGLMINGSGLAKDIAGGTALLRRACSTGHQEACALIPR